MFEAHCISAFSIFVQSLVPEVMLSQNKNFYIAVYCSPYSYLFFCFTYTLNSGIFNIIILLNISLVTLFLESYTIQKFDTLWLTLTYFIRCVYLSIFRFGGQKYFFDLKVVSLSNSFSIFKNIVTISCVFNF